METETAQKAERPKLKLMASATRALSKNTGSFDGAHFVHSARRGARRDAVASGTLHRPAFLVPSWLFRNFGRAEIEARELLDVRIHGKAVSVLDLTAHPHPVGTDHPAPPDRPFTPPNHLLRAGVPLIALLLALFLLRDRDRLHVLTRRDDDRPQPDRSLAASTRLTEPGDSLRIRLGLPVTRPP